jgi:hypothetical protein
VGGRYMDPEEFMAMLREMRENPPPPPTDEQLAEISAAAERLRDDPEMRAAIAEGTAAIQAVLDRFARATTSIDAR